MKTFYVISSLSSSNSYRSLPDRKRFNTESEALDHARALIMERQQNGDRDLSFFVLKAVALVGTKQPPVKVTKL